MTRMEPSIRKLSWLRVLQTRIIIFPGRLLSRRNIPRPPRKRKGHCVCWGGVEDDLCPKKEAISLPILMSMQRVRILSASSSLSLLTFFFFRPAENFFIYTFAISSSVWVLTAKKKTKKRMPPRTHTPHCRPPLRENTSIEPPEIAKRCEPGASCESQQEMNPLCPPLPPNEANPLCPPLPPHEENPLGLSPSLPPRPRTTVYLLHSITLENTRLHAELTLVRHTRARSMRRCAQIVPVVDNRVEYIRRLVRRLADYERLRFMCTVQEKRHQLDCWRPHGTRRRRNGGREGEAEGQGEVERQSCEECEFLALVLETACLELTHCNELLLHVRENHRLLVLLGDYLAVQERSDEWRNRFRDMNDDASIGVVWLNRGVEFVYGLISFKPICSCPNWKTKIACENCMCDQQ